MTVQPPARSIDADAAATIDAAARYITGQLARQRLLETTGPHGWDLARRLALIADALTGDGNTTDWVAATLPQPRQSRPPQPPTPSLNWLFPHGGDTAAR